MRYISDTEIENASAHTPPSILDIANAYDTAVFMDSLTDTFGVPKEGKSIVAEEIFFLILRITSVSEAIARITERIDTTKEVSVGLIAQFGETFKGTIPTETAPEQVPTPISKPLLETRQSIPVSSSGLKELNDLEPKIVPKLPVAPELGKWATQKTEPSHQANFGTVPDASNELKERLELRPKNIIKQSFTEPKVEEDEIDEGPKPLTRTQILQSLTSKRTMASDIASIHKTSDTNTHT